MWLHVRLGRLPGASRRFTGSCDTGSFDPASMPDTVWLDDQTPSIDPDVVVAAPVPRHLTAARPAGRWARHHLLWRSRAQPVEPGGVCRARVFSARRLIVWNS